MAHLLLAITVGPNVNYNFIVEDSMHRYARTHVWNSAAGCLKLIKASRPAPLLICRYYKCRAASVLPWPARIHTMV